MFFRTALHVLLAALWICILEGASQLINSELNLSLNYTKDDVIGIIGRYEVVHTNSTSEQRRQFLPKSKDPCFSPPNPADDLTNFVSPNGPLLRSNWDDHCVEKERTKNAFLEALQLAQEVLTYMYAAKRLYGPTSSFIRYFDFADFDTIYLIFKNIFNVPDPVTNEQPGGPVHPRFLNIDLRYDAPRGEISGHYVGECDGVTDPRQLAGFYQGAAMAPWISDPIRGVLFLCPLAYTDPDLPQIQDKTICDKLKLKPYAQQTIDVLGATILHELMHYDYMTKEILALNGRHIDDYDAEEDDSNPYDDPPDGYGPYNAMRMRQRQRTPLLNADNYVWFALEVWWQKKCSIFLNDPPAPKDEGNPEPANALTDTFALPDGTTQP